MVKGYQAYRDSWATVLSEEILCLREVGDWVNFSLTWRLGREAWHSKVWSIAVSCYAKIKTAKMSSKVNTAFWRNFAPAISRYCVEVSCVCTQPLARVWYWDNTSTPPPREQPKSSFELYSRQRKQRRTMLQQDKQLSWYYCYRNDLITIDRNSECSTIAQPYLWHKWLSWYPPGSWDPANT